MTNIILATSSPYRIEMFNTLGIPFSTESSNINEQFANRPKNPEELAKVLAKLKAEAVAKKHNNAIVIGIDSLGYYNNHILEKPRTLQNAFQRLKMLSGKDFTHRSTYHKHKNQKTRYKSCNYKS